MDPATLPDSRKCALPRFTQNWFLQPTLTSIRRKALDPTTFGRASRKFLPRRLAKVGECCTQLSTPRTHVVTALAGPVVSLDRASMTQAILV